VDSGIDRAYITARTSGYIDPSYGADVAFGTGTSAAGKYWKWTTISGPINYTNMTYNVWYPVGDTYYVGSYLDTPGTSTRSASIQFADDDVGTNATTAGTWNFAVTLVDLLAVDTTSNTLGGYYYCSQSQPPYSCPLVTTIACGGVSVSASGGTPPYSYSWGSQTYLMPISQSGASATCSAVDVSRNETRNGTIYVIVTDSSYPVQEVIVYFSVTAQYEYSIF
jgi:hypothetical protein